MANAFLQLLNTPVGQFATQVALLTGSMYGLYSLIKAMGILKNVAAAFTTLTTAMTATTAATGAATAGVTAFGVALNTALPIVGAIALAIAAIVNLAPMMSDWFKDVTNDVDYANEKLEENNNKLVENKQRLEELYQVPVSNRTGVIEAEIASLERENAELEENIEKWQRKANIGTLEDIREGDYEGRRRYIFDEEGQIETFFGRSLSTDYFVETEEEAIDFLKSIGRVAEDFTGTLEEAGYHLVTVSDGILNSEQYYATAITQQREFIDAVEHGVDVSVDEIEASAKRNKEIEAYIAVLEAVPITELTDQEKENLEAAKGLSRAYQEARVALYDANEALDILSQGMVINELQSEALADAYPELASALEETSLGYQINQEKLEDLAKAGNEAARSLINAQIEQTKQTISSIKQRIEMYHDELDALAAYKVIDKFGTLGDRVEWASKQNLSLYSPIKTPGTSDYDQTLAQLQAEEDALAEAQDKLDALMAEAESWEVKQEGLIDDPGGVGGGTASKAVDILKTQSDAFSELNELTEDNIYFKEKEGASTEELIALYRDYLDQLKQQEEWFRSQGEGDESKYVRDLKRQQIDLQDTITQLQQDAFDDRLQISEDYMDERNELDDWGADNEIAALQRVLDWMDEWYDKGLIDYEYYWEKRVDVAKRKAQAEKEAWEESLNAQIEAYEKQQDAYETLFSIITDNIQKEIDALEEQKADIEESYQQQIDDLQQVNDELEDQIANEEALDALARARQSKVMVYKDGRFQYINDIDQVSEAQANLEKLERDRILEEEVKKLEELRDRELESIDEQIEGWEEYKKEWESVVDDYQEEQDRLLVLQELGIDLEGDNWKLRLDNLQSYIAEYKALMAELANAQELLNQGYQAGNIEISTPGVGITPGTGSLAGTQNNAWANVSGTGFAATTVDSSGQPTKWGLPAGTIIYTDNGAYKITGGGKYDGDPYEMEYYGKTPSNIWTPSKGGGTSSSGGSSGGVGGSSSGGKGSSSGGSSSGGNKYQGSASGGNNIKDSYDINSPAGQEFVDTAKPGDELDGGDGSHWVKNENGTITITRGDDEWTVPAHAMGTLGARGGFSLVGEKGPELRVLNSGDGVIPADVTKNLWGWGSISPGNFFGSILDKITGGTNVTISSLTLPNVHDPEGFIEYFNSAMWRRTLQFQTS